MLEKERRREASRRCGGDGGRRGDGGGSGRGGLGDRGVAFYPSHASILVLVHANPLVHGVLLCWGECVDGYNRMLGGEDKGERRGRGGGEEGETIRTYVYQGQQFLRSS